MYKNKSVIVSIIILIIISLILSFTVDSCSSKPLQDDIKINKTEYYGKGVRQSGYIHNHINNI